MFIHVDASKGYDQIEFTLPFVMAMLIIIWNLDSAVYTSIEGLPFSE